MVRTKRVARAAVAIVMVYVGAGDTAGQGVSTSGRPMTVDDLFSLQEIGEVVPSPDGDWLAYVIRREPRSARDYSRLFMVGNDYADIWIVPSTGGTPRNITNGQSDSSGYFAPVWSPDGSRLALQSTNGGDVHLWIWERESGRLRQVISDRASAGTAVSDVAWLDNTRLVTTVMPPGKSPLAWIIERMPAVTLLEAWPKTWAGRESTASVLDAGTGEIPITRPREELRIVDVEHATSRPLTTGEVTAFFVSPDRRRIAFLRRIASYQPTAGERLGARPNRDRYEIGVLAADGREIWPKVEGLGTTLGVPQLHWSDDGRYLAVIAHAAQGNAPDDRLYRLDVERRTVEDVAGEQLDLGGASVLWATNGRLLLYARLRSKDAASAASAGDGMDASPAPARSQSARSDWWLIAGAGQRRNLTQSMSEVPAQLRRTSQANTLIGLADSAVWMIDLRGAAQISLLPDTFAAKYGAIAWPSDAGVRSDVIVLTSTRNDVEQYHRFDIAARAATPIAKPATDSRIAAAVPERDAFYFTTENHEGTSLALVRSADGAPLVFASLNTFLREITPGQTRSFEYRTSDGKEVKGWLLLPPGYVEGRRYPMVLWVYAGSMMGDSPPRATRLNSFSPFNMQVAAAHGYVVMFPSIPLEPTPRDSDWTPSDPYLDLPKGVLPAVDKVIDMGIADPKKIGVMGQSYGGYSTMSLITQTDRFAAAVSIAGASNLVSLYGQFETRMSAEDYRMESTGRDGYFIGWSEDGQGRMGSPPWRDMQRYIRNSPITYADRIDTPLMLVHGDRDIIGMTQAQEMFTALHRQNKRVRFVRYWGEGHVLNSPANIKDFWERTLEWFDMHFGEAEGKGRGHGADPEYP